MLAAGSSQGALGGCSRSRSSRSRLSGRCGMRPVCAAGTAQQVGMGALHSGGCVAHRCADAPCSAVQAAGEVTIRRRPTADAPTCGLVQRATGAAARSSAVASQQLLLHTRRRPSNILEEIVWYKDVEISGWRAQQPLAAVQVRVECAAAGRRRRGSCLVRAPTRCLL